jgi:hypothetical protein
MVSVVGLPFGVAGRVVGGGEGFFRTGDAFSDATGLSGTGSVGGLLAAVASRAANSVALRFGFIRSQHYDVVMAWTYNFIRS